MKNKIMEVLNHYKTGISFAQFEHIEGFTGDYAWGSVEHNIFFWFTMSEEAIDVLDSLFQDGEIEIVPTNYMTYFIDGSVPNVPIAKDPKRKYKKDRWLPVVINYSPKP